MKMTMDSYMTSQIDDMTESMKKVLQDEKNSILKDLDQYIEEPFKYFRIIFHRSIFGAFSASSIGII